MAEHPARHCRCAVRSCGGAIRGSRTVRPLKSIAKAIRALAGGEQHTLIPATDVENEIGDIARAAEVFRRSLVDADTAREAAIHALAEQRLAEESYRKLFEGSVDGIYVTTPGGALLNANPALARIMGYETPEELINAVSDITQTIYVNPSARALYQSMMQRDGTVRDFEYQVRQRTGSILWLSDSATVVRDEAGERLVTRVRFATLPTRSVPKMRSPRVAGSCSR